MNKKGEHLIVHLAHAGGPQEIKTLTHIATLEELHELIIRMPRLVQQTPDEQSAQLTSAGRKKAELIGSVTVPMPTPPRAQSIGQRNPFADLAGTPPPAASLPTPPQAESKERYYLIHNREKRVIEVGQLGYIKNMLLVLLNNEEIDIGDVVLARGTTLPKLERRTKEVWALMEEEPK